MINQPFRAQTVWFLFISAYDYSKDSAEGWEYFDREVVFNGNPVGLFTSEKEIFENLDSELEELKKKLKKDIQSDPIRNANPEYQKIINSKNNWRRVLDYDDQPPIQFAEVDYNGRIIEKGPIGDPPNWLKSKRVVMEIWEAGGDVYCFMEVIF